MKSLFPIQKYMNPRALYFICSTLPIRVWRVFIYLFTCLLSFPPPGLQRKVLLSVLCSRTVPGTQKWLHKYLWVTHHVPLFCISLEWNMRKRKKRLTFPANTFPRKMLSGLLSTPLGWAKPGIASYVCRYSKKGGGGGTVFSVLPKGHHYQLWHIFEEKEVLAIWQYIPWCLICLL